MPNDKCRKLKFIDRDCRVIEYEDFLHSKGFEYRDTRLASSGGVRSYDNKVINKTVEVMKSPDFSGIQYWIGRLSDVKKLAMAKG